MTEATDKLYRVSEVSVTRPRHRRTRYFVARGLFNGLENFGDLEARIAALPTERDRGDAFEVFVVGAEEVWPGNQVPIARRVGPNPSSWRLSNRQW